LANTIYAENIVEGIKKVQYTFKVTDLAGNTAVVSNRTLEVEKIEEKVKERKKEEKLRQWDTEF